MTDYERMAQDPGTGSGPKDSRLADRSPGPRLEALRGAAERVLRCL